MWTVPTLWADQSCFIVCGGPSVRDLDLSRLADRRVIAINSSYGAVPHADYLIFTDRRWWIEHRESVRSTFRGRVVTITPMPETTDYLLLDRQRSGGLSPDRRRLALWHTTTTAAINLAVHLGSKQINLLGLDGEGGWHHAPHKWRQGNDKFKYHGLALEALVESLRELDVRAYNANPRAAHRMFPHHSYEEMTQ